MSCQSRVRITYYTLVSYSILLYVFQIYVNGHLHQKVRSASRTKALLHGLNLKKVDFELSIHSIGCHGTTVSTSDVVNYVKEMVLKPPPVPMSTKK